MPKWILRLFGHLFAFVLVSLLLVVAAGAFTLQRRPARYEAGSDLNLTSGSLQFQGRTRSFSLCLPATFTSSKTYPVVMFLHGGFGSAQQIASSTGLCSHVDEKQFIAVFPNAVGNQWNDGRDTTENGADDVGFIGALIKYLAQNYGADTQRVYVAGPSNGGNMTMRLACEATDSFRAFGVVVADLPEDLRSHCPSRPIPILFIQSRDDPAVPWGGRDQPEPSRGRGFAKGGLLMSAPDTVSFFAKASGCTGVDVRELPDQADDGTSVRLHTFTGCRPGAEVLQYEVIGAGHGWPGSSERRGPRMEERFGKVSQEISATQILLDFFSRHGL